MVVQESYLTGTMSVACELAWAYSTPSLLATHSRKEGVLWVVKAHMCSVEIIRNLINDLAHDHNF
jgi:hypothetical protein